MGELHAKIRLDARAVDAALRLADTGLRSIRIIPLSRYQGLRSRAIGVADDVLRRVATDLIRLAGALLTAADRISLYGCARRPRRRDP